MFPSSPSENLLLTSMAGVTDERLLKNFFCRSHTPEVSWQAGRWRTGIIGTAKLDEFGVD